MPVCSAVPLLLGGARRAAAHPPRARAARAGGLGVLRGRSATPCRGGRATREQSLAAHTHRPRRPSGSPCWRAYRQRPPSKRSAVALLVGFVAGTASADVRHGVVHAQSLMPKGLASPCNGVSAEGRTSAGPRRPACRPRRRPCCLRRSSSQPRCCQECKSQDPHSESSHCLNSFGVGISRCALDRRPSVMQGVFRAQGATSEHDSDGTVFGCRRCEQQWTRVEEDVRASSICAPGTSRPRRAEPRPRPPKLGLPRARRARASQERGDHGIDVAVGEDQASGRRCSAFRNRNERDEHPNTRQEGEPKPRGAGRWASARQKLKERMATASPPNNIW